VTSRWASRSGSGAQEWAPEGSLLRCRHVLIETHLDQSGKLRSHPLDRSNEFLQIERRADPEPFVADQFTPTQQELPHSHDGFDHGEGCLRDPATSPQLLLAGVRRHLLGMTLASFPVLVVPDRTRLSRLG